MTLETRRVLAVGAHPDDVEILCAGTFFALRQQGHEIHVASLTSGDCGSAVFSAEEISRIRRGEAQRACEMLGATYRQAGFTDLCIYNDDGANRRVTALLREVNPSIVITHSPQDYMSDHETASLLVRNACFNAPIRNYLTAAGPTQAIPHLYYGQPAEGADIFGKRVTPQFYVDVGDFMRQKEEMLSCHESQREWLRAHHGMDEYVESVRRWNASMGGRASQISGQQIKQAEAFRQHVGHAYPQDNALAYLLGGRVVSEPHY